MENYKSDIKAVLIVIVFVLSVLGVLKIVDIVHQNSINYYLTTQCEELGDKYGHRWYECDKK